MAVKKLAMLSGQSEKQQLLQQCMAGQTEPELSLVDTSQKGPADFIIVDTKSCSNYNFDPKGPAVILLGDNLLTLAADMERIRPRHIFFNAHDDGAINFNEVIWACQISGAMTPDKFFSDPPIICQRSLTSTGQIESMVKEIFSGTNLNGLFANADEQLYLMANELLTNALYSAPLLSLDKDFQQAAEQRKAVQLPEQKKITIQTLSNDKELAIVVTDPFGSLTPDTLYRYLGKGLEGTINHEEKKGGAGMGIALLRSFCHRLAFNIEVGASTQVICYIEKKKRHKEHQTQCKSMHIFVKE